MAKIDLRRSGGRRTRTRRHGKLSELGLVPLVLSLLLLALALRRGVALLFRRFRWFSFLLLWLLRLCGLPSGYSVTSLYFELFVELLPLLLRELGHLGLRFFLARPLLGLRLRSSWSKRNLLGRWRLE